MTTAEAIEPVRDSMPRPKVFLNPGGDRRLGRGHVWAFSNEIRMDAEAKAISPGTIVDVHRVDGKPVGTATFNPHALIAIRLLSRRPRTSIDAAWFGARIETALALRAALFAEPYYRLIHAEADGLPGLVIDRYGTTLVVQANTAGMDRLLPVLTDALMARLQPERIVVRGDAPSRGLEGLEPQVFAAAGVLPEEPQTLIEGGVTFFADVATGQKTGWFFDQRRNRAAVAPLARDGRLLDVFTHTGAFAVHAAVAGARDVVAIDSSAPALALAERAAGANAVTERCTFRQADAFAELERLSTTQERFRVVAADPPPFARSKRDVGSALRGYRKLARLTSSLVEPGGFLFIASCSHNVEGAAFATEVAAGLDRAERSGRIIRVAGAGPDHPIHPHLPETAYLKSLILHLD